MSELIRESSKDIRKWEDYETILCPDGYVVNMAKLLDEQERAKAALVHLAPEFGGFVSKLRFVYTFCVQTQATDGYNILVNPQFTDKLPFDGKVFVMAHEIMHCLLNHMRRGVGHDPQRSNIAADYEVNGTLVDIELFKSTTVTKLNGLYDKKYSNWGYEKIYTDVTANANGTMSNKNQAQQAQKNSSQAQGDSDGNGGSGQPAYSDDYKAGWAQAIEDYKSGKLKL